jgi:hypothetical protein
MFLFRPFDTYAIKVLGGHLKEKRVLGGHRKEKRRRLKHHTTFCIPQQAIDNTYGFHVCLSIVVLGAQPNYNVCVSAFILL